MNRFYKYLKSFDSFILDYSKLIGKILSVFAVLVFIYKLYTSDLDIKNLEWRLSPNWILWFFVFIISFILNHSLDAYIWRFILQSRVIDISLKEAIQMNWKSLLYSVSTPNRIGEIPARRILLKEHDITSVYKSAGLHYIFKPVTFLLLLVISLYFEKSDSYVLGIILFGFILSCILFVIYKFGRMFIQLIALNILRVISYCLQHIVLLIIFGGVVFDFSTLNSVVFIHSSGALIPHVFGTEIFIKSAVFDLIHINQLSWGIFTFSLFILWVINIIIPALVALGFKKI